MKAYGARHFDASLRRCKVVKATRARERATETKDVGDGVMTWFEWPFWFMGDWFDDQPDQEAEMWASFRGED